MADDWGDHISRWQRVKWWARNHDEAIMLGVIGTVCVGILVIGVKAEMSFQEQATAELNGYIDELNALFANLPDGAL